MYKINVDINNKQFEFCEVSGKNRGQNPVEFLKSARSVIAAGYQPKFADLTPKIDEYNKLCAAATTIYNNRLPRFLKLVDVIFKRFQFIQKMIHGIYATLISNKHLQVDKLYWQILGLTRHQIREHGLNQKPVGEQFNELIRRLSQKKKDKIAAFIANQPKNQFLASLLQAGDWKSLKQLAMENRDKEGRSQLTFEALSLVKQGIITVSQFSTFMLFLSACKQHGPEKVEILPIFQNGKVNQAVDDLILQTMLVGNQYFKGLPTKRCDSRVTRDEMEAIYIMLQNGPKSEQFLFKVPDHSKAHTPDRVNPFISITQRIQLDIGINEFGRLRGNKKERMVSSIGAVQALLDATTPFKFQMNPVFGSSSPSDISKNGKNNSRDVQIPYAPSKTGLIPKKADNFTVEVEYDMTEHDFFHCKRCAHVPPKYQKAFMRSVDLISNKILKTKAASISPKVILKFKQKFRWSIIDMERPIYTYNQSPSIFWYYLIRDAHRFEEAARESDFSKTEVAKILRFFIGQLEKDMKRHPGDWKAFEISPSSVGDGIKYYEKMFTNRPLFINLLKEYFLAPPPAMKGG